jgi:hypothetical protein
VRQDAEKFVRLSRRLSAFLFEEETAQSLGTDVGFDALGIGPYARALERDGISQVGGENLDRSLTVNAFQIFDEGDGDGIGFLAGGAFQAPIPGLAFRPHRSSRCAERRHA